MHWTLALPALATVVLAVPHKRQDESISSVSSLTYNETVVFHHNLHRANHSSVNITWDEQLASTAQKLANLCNFEHNLDIDASLYARGYGQNLAAGVPGENISYIISDLFYNGEAPLFADYYNMSQPPMTEFMRWGHFTQVVWNETLTVGCATQQCTNGIGNAAGVEPYLTVCNYGGPGNYQGQYDSNVGEPLGLPTATWANSTGLPACDLLNCTVTPAQNAS